VDSVIEECNQIDWDYGAELIYFQDDCFGTSLDWLEEFVKKYKGPMFHCQLRPEMINRARLNLLAQAGCHGITMAIETINEQVRRERLNRRMTNDQISSACSLIKEYGFKLRTEQMLGLPQTTIEDELELLKFNIDAKPSMAWTSIFVPYLGTELGDWCKANGMYDGNNDDISGSFFSDTKLNFDADRKMKTNLLQRIFMICTKIPFGEILAKNCLKNNISSIDDFYTELKKHLFDYELYNIYKS
jgi:radical SAM superfamily enzyme YgiQ (UPF0313 family)